MTTLTNYIYYVHWGLLLLVAVLFIISLFNLWRSRTRSQPSLESNLIGLLICSALYCLISFYGILIDEVNLTGYSWLLIVTGLGIITFIGQLVYLVIRKFKN